ncbi:MAG: transposase, partial [Coriobacteriia bacterium]|nr:transposase [Coriobacteriia bacterium]
MHSQEQRQKAVQFFIEGGKSKGAVARSLGYGSAWSVERWYEDYMSQGFLKESRTKWFKFTEAQKQSAVAHFLDTGQNFSATIRTLGYPSRALLTL